MRLHDDIDFTTLNWVKQELDETLKQARQALEAYVEDPSDTSQMRFCATYLHQVQGTLRMVELHGAALVIDEMEQVSLALLDGRVLDTDDAYALLMRGIVQLPDYLERLQSGHRDIPVVLLPLLNDLRAARGEGPLLEAALFAPNLSVDLPASAAGPDQPVPDRALRVACAKIRKNFEAALLHWFKDDAGPEVVTYLKNLCDRLCRITSEIELRRSWWIAGGVLDGVANGAVKPGKALKLQFGRLDREIKEMALHGERYFGAHPPDELCKALLYYVAQAGSGSDRIDELKDTFRLEQLVPRADELDHARGAMSGHNRELLSTVSGAIKEDLLRVKDALDLKVRQHDRTTEGFADQCRTLERVADTLGMLGMGTPRKVVLDQKEHLEQLISADDEPSENSLLDIAGSLLYVESSLDDYIDLLGAAETEPESSADAVPDLPKSEVRRILDALMKEASGNLQVIKQSIVEFIEAPWDHERVKDTPRLLEEIVGALRMLDLSEAAMLLEGVIAYNEVELLQKRSVPDAEELDTFADALASIEYYLEAVREHRPGRDKILEVARQSLSKLGYLGDQAAESRRRAEAEAEAPPPDLAEAAPEDATPESAEAELGEAPPQAAEAETAPSASADLADTLEFEAPAAEAEETSEPAREPATADIADDIDEEIREVFIEEVEEELANLRELHATWKADPEDQQTLTTIRRTFHTLKGSGRLVGALIIGEFSWQIENMLNRVLDGTIEPSPPVVDLMDHALGALPGLLANVKGEGRPEVDIEAIKRVAERLASGEEVWLEPAATADAEPEQAVEGEAVAESEEPVETEAVAEPVGETETEALAEPAEETEAEAVAESLEETEIEAIAEPAEDTEAVAEPAEEVESAAELEPSAELEAEEGLEADLEALDASELAASEAGEFDLAEGLEAELEALDESEPEEFEAAGAGLAEGLEADLEALDASGLEGAEARDIDLAEGLEAELEALEESEPEEIETGEVDLAEAPEPESPALDQMETEPSPAERSAAEEPEPVDADTLEFEVPEALAESSADAGDADLAADEAWAAFAEGLSRDERPAEAEPSDASEQHATEPPAEAGEYDDMIAAAAIELESDEAAQALAAEGLDYDLESFLDEISAGEATEESAEPEEFPDLDALEEELVAEGGDEAPLGSIDPVLREILRTEVASHLGVVAHYLASAEEGRPAVVNESLLRAVHTLNGAIAMVDLPALAAVTGPLEGYVKRLRLGEQAPDDAGFEALEEAVRTVRAVVDGLDRPDEEAIDTTELSLRLSALRDELPEPESLSSLFPVIDEGEAAEFGAEDLEAAETAPASGPDVEAEDLSVIDLDADIEPFEPLSEAEEIAVDEGQQLAVGDELEPDAAEPALEAKALGEAEVGEAETVDEAEAMAEVEDVEPIAAAEEADEVAEAEGAGEVSAEDVEPIAEADHAEEVAEAEDVLEATAERGEPIGEVEEAEQVGVDEGEEAAAVAEEGAVESVGEAADEEAESLVSEKAEADAESPPERADAADEIAGEAIAALASDLEAWEKSAEEFGEVVLPEEETVSLAELGEIDDDLLEIFLQEGAEILDESDHKMARWRGAPDDHEAVVQLQRELHTLKGGARMTGLAPIGDLSHAMESLFEGVVEDRVEVTRRTIEILEYGFDRLHQMLAKVRAREPISTGRGAIMQIEALLTGTIPLIPEVTEEKELPSAEAPEVDKPEPVETAEPVAAPEPASPEALKPTTLDEADARGTAPARPQQELIRVRADLLDNLVNYAGEVSIYRSRLEQQIGTFRFNLVEFDQTVTRLRDQLRKLEMETEAQILSRYQREAEEMEESFDPLELDRFSTLQQLSRALAESVSDLVSIQGMLDDLTRQSETLLLQQSRVNSDLQEGLMRTRMVPFDSLVPRLRRILRQTSQELGKRASLRVEGAQGEMDRTVLERITAPLEHMLRNAIVHGLEAPEGRERAGKPAEGTIRMSVTREATEVVITVADDGAGIDHDRVREKALERGLLKADAELTDRDLYGFILESGFTTVEEVTKVAGRGVGMDVVNNEIKQLGGSLDISSVRGAGTTFVIRLPFTLAVTHAIMVRVGDSTFAVPLSSIQGVVRMSRREFDERLAAGDTTYEFTGEDYQLQELTVLLGLERRGQVEDEMVPVLMSQIGDQRAALRVDLVMGSREVVVKSVGPQISSVPGIFGATILGDGSVVMILDLGPLIRRGAALRLTAAEPVSLEAEVEPEQAPERLPLIMVVDDSITMRKVTTRVLQRHDMKVVTAKDGVDALEQLQDRLPDLMLLDIEMPRMDGYELAIHMRNDARLKRVPIIMVTSRSGAKHRERALEIGVNRYLGKPYQEAELLSNVRELLDETVAAE